MDTRDYCHQEAIVAGSGPSGMSTRRESATAPKRAFAVSLWVNGRAVAAEVPATRTLLDFLRDDLGLTGVKEGCGKGECGACTVIVDGRPVNSCLTLAYQVNGKRVETVEGLDRHGLLHPIQEAFVAEGAVQCGFCTPGMILSAKALLDANPSPTKQEIKEAISGNLCRCTGYAKIIRAIEVAAATIRKSRQSCRPMDAEGGRAFEVMQGRAEAPEGGLPK